MCVRVYDNHTYTYTYIYVCVCVFMHVHMYIYIYISVCVLCILYIIYIYSVRLYMPHSSLAFLVSVSHQPETPGLITDDLVARFRSKQYVSHTQKPGLDSISQGCYG